MSFLSKAVQLQLSFCSMTEVLVPLVAEARAGSLTYVIQPERAIYLAIWDSGAYKLICWLDPMSLNIEKKAREPRPHHVLKHPQTRTGWNSTWYTVPLLFAFQASGILEKVDVFASEVAKMLPGSNFPKISKAWNAKRIKFPRNS